MIHLILIFTSILDLPTIITAIGSARTKSLFKAILIALAAALIGEVIKVATRPAYSFLSFFLYGAIGQIIVAIVVFKVAQIIRRIENKYFRNSVALISVILPLCIAAILISLILTTEAKQKSVVVSQDMQPIHKPIDVAEEMQAAQKPVVVTKKSPSDQMQEDKQSDIDMMLETHKAVTGSYLPSARAVMQSAEEGMPEAQNVIATHYKNGTGGLPQDYVKAYMWASLSAMQGNATALDIRLELMQSMTSQQVIQGERLAKERLH